MRAVYKPSHSQELIGGFGPSKTCTMTYVLQLLIQSNINIDSKGILVFNVILGHRDKLILLITTMRLAFGVINYGSCCQLMNLHLPAMPRPLDI